MKKLTGIFVRSFMIQAVWNYETMQSLGFLYMLYPNFKKIFSREKDLKNTFNRHMDYFNTHPYMALFVAGEVLRMEEKYFSDGKDPGEITLIKKQLGGPLAALGDKLFWSTWRPLSGLIGVAAAMIVYNSCRNIPCWMIPAGFFILFNLPVIYFKAKSLRSSYTGRAHIVVTLKKIRRNAILRYLPVIGLSIIAAILFSALFLYETRIYGWYLIAGTAVTVFLRMFFKISATRLVYLISLAVIAGNFMFSFIVK